MTNLFQYGRFTLNSGAQSCFKLECDSLTDEDWQCLAHMIAQMVGPFGTVEGVPTGGLKLANALHTYQASSAFGLHLIVDDVLTTGGSMQRLKELTTRDNDVQVKGAVVFARGKCPEWVKPLFQLHESLWLGKS